jgi:REP element-mobilizing transposase RayT
MTYPRKSLVSLSDTPYYHVVARCVRRAWLWGFDAYAGKDYSHRKEWVLERLALLSSIFAIDICAYAVMSNHYHLVLYVDQLRAQQLSEREVVEGWSQLFDVPLQVRRYLSGDASESEADRARSMILVWRTRLHDISWFMKCLNEHLARRANAEDKCTGKFWEGRFKSQALVDEAGLLTAMVYVDLNPIRAGIAETPEGSTFTSIRERLRNHVSGDRISQSAKPTPSVVRLRTFQSDSKENSGIPYRREDYFELVDWTGRLLRADKRGAIDARLPPIMQRLRIDGIAWEAAMQSHGNVFGRAMGRLDHLRLHARTIKQSWVRGLRASQKIYG